MPVVFDVVWAAYEALKQLKGGFATAGSSASQIVDSQLPLIGWPADTFNGGVALSQAQKQIRVITDYLANGTISVSPNFGVAVNAGDYYAIASKRYRIGIIYAALNSFLRELGDLPTTDTSLTTVAGQREYSLPVAAKRDLRQVWVAQQTSSPYNYVQELTPRVEWSAANAVGTLIFPADLVSGLKIKLIYMAPHPTLKLETDLISDYVSVDWAALEVAVRAVKERMEEPGDNQKALTATLNDLMVQANLARRQRRLDLPVRQPVVNSWNYL